METIQSEQQKETQIKKRKQEYKLVQPLWRTVWRFLKKLKIELPYDPADLLLAIYPEKTN